VGNRLVANQVNSKSGDFSCKVDELSLSIPPVEISDSKINPHLFNQAAKKNKLTSGNDQSMLSLVKLLKKKA